MLAARSEIPVVSGYQPLCFFLLQRLSPTSLYASSLASSAFPYGHGVILYPRKNAFVIKEQFRPILSSGKGTPEGKLRILRLENIGQIPLYLPLCSGQVKIFSSPQHGSKVRFDFVFRYISRTAKTESFRHAFRGNSGIEHDAFFEKPLLRFIKQTAFLDIEHVIEISRGCSV